MAEFSLDVDEIKKDVETTLKQEEEKLENSNIKNQADENAVAIFEADFRKRKYFKTIGKLWYG